MWLKLVSLIISFLRKCRLSFSAMGGISVCVTGMRKRALWKNPLVRQSTCPRGTLQVGVEALLEGTYAFQSAGSASVHIHKRDGVDTLVFHCVDALIGRIP